MSDAGTQEAAGSDPKVPMLTSEFRHQYTVNSRQLVDLKRIRRATVAKLGLLYFLLLSTGVVVAATLWFSFGYIHTQLTIVTVGALYDFGISLLIVLLILVGLAFLLYYLVLSLLGAQEDLNEVAAVIRRQARVIDAMAPYIEGVSLV